LSPARLRKAIEFVRANLDNCLTLDSMAKAVDLSPSYFGEMFRISTGKTPHQYLREQRMERAKQMLQSKDARILDVAIACGFRTQQHFARIFRRTVGISPRQYRGNQR
jgi:AraC family transcriptional regulator